MSVKATYVQDGDAIDHTPNADVNAGDVVDLGTFVGVALHPISAGRTGALQIRGTFDFVKAASEAISFGATVYWEDTNQVATGTVGYSDATIGKCVKAAAGSDATVRVTLTPGAA